MNKGQNAIEKIREFERFGSVLGLERMTELLRRLGDPQDELEVIHVAGTNGKGSVSRYIYSVLKEAGYRTGLYTSPFLEKFNERIELDGSCISDDDLALYTDRVLAAAEAMADAGLDSPTEFEVVTAIAFLYFREKACDYVVLEVGLGGRGDSTNVCKKPLATVITSISMDHMDRLGNTIEEIAAEKAGIIKEGCPLVTSARGSALAVIEKVASQKQAPLYKTADLPVRVREASLEGSTFDIELPCGRRAGGRYEGVRISMAGRHQIENAAAAMTALAVLEEEGCDIPAGALYAGLAKARQTGRLEVFPAPWNAAASFAAPAAAPRRPLVILDGAHNEGGAKALADAITALAPEARTLMVTGVLADKDAEAILRQFMRITKDFIATEPDSPRRMKAEELAERIRKAGGRCRAIEDAGAAFAAACETAAAGAASAAGYDLVICAGSLYMIGKVRTILKG